MTAPINNEDKLAWCKHGDALEKEFVMQAFDSGVSVIRNPAKAHDPYTHDLLAVFQSDLKSIGTPFRTADRYGFDPAYAITINEKDIDRYAERYPNIVLFLNIDYPSYKGVRMATLYRLQKFIEHGRAKKHEYIHRTGDTQGNAKASYIFDLRWLDEVKL